MKVMPNKISNLTYIADKRGLQWICDTQLVERRFANPVKAVPFRTGTGLVVVEPASDEAPDNAIIFNPDGTLRVKVKNPETGNGAICFGDAYYVQDDLTLIICFASWQMACVIDEFGKVLKTYETR